MEKQLYNIEIITRFILKKVKDIIKILIKLYKTART